MVCADRIESQLISVVFGSGRCRRIEGSANACYLPHVLRSS